MPKPAASDPVKIRAEKAILVLSPSMPATRAKKREAERLLKRSDGAEDGRVADMGCCGASGAAGALPIRGSDAASSEGPGWLVGVLRVT
ncbi:hypothetical protein ASE36_03670 [Rhizobium sp. Root274]|nr:hypothetical protein ASC71_03670 [Rhizobium sp. Root1240]KRD32910.1 hypothetical protein ASE36_03670 [Rhizobium sp. Root274]